MSRSAPASIPAPTPSPSTPLLFRKRAPVAPATAAQYVGTDTEIDVK
jgi:hypothetical protein